jgi:CHAT domain-containing protein
MRDTAERLGTTFVVYSLIRRPSERIDPNADVSVFIWVIPPDRTKPILFRQSGPLRPALPDGEAPDWRQTTSDSPGTWPRFLEGGTPGEIQADLRWLHAWLIDPVAEALPSDPQDLVTFVAMGKLLVVPFAALPDRAGRPLIERHTIAVTPSVQTLLLTEGRDRHGKGALAVGTSGRSTLLRFAPSEASMAARKFDTMPLLGKMATREAVIEAMPGKQVLHFATHAVFDAGDDESY